MSQTYKATGINLKAMPMGESDRLLTILTREYGLVRAVAMGSRKHNSRLGGRSALFVVNELLIAKGKSLDKVTQAETLESYPGLSQDLKKLTASQYLAELCLCQALSDQPQEELFALLSEHLKRLEASPASHILAHLTQGVFQLLVLAGIAPQVHLCCMTDRAIHPDFSHLDRQTGFSIPLGGVVALEALERLKLEKQPPQKQVAEKQSLVKKLYATEGLTQSFKVAETKSHMTSPPRQPAVLNFEITAAELAVLQELAQAELPQPETFIPSLAGDVPAADLLWLSIERILRHYAQYHFDRPIRSATLIDACFASADYSSTPKP